MFTLPIGFDLLATFSFAVTGGLIAMRKGYDFIGVFALALASGLGGGLLRDGLFLQNGPPVMMTDARYLQVVAFGGVVGIIFGERLTARTFQRVFSLMDALGLGAYAVVGVQKSLDLGFGFAPAILVGIVNAVGGGLLRDILSKEETLFFKPGHFYAAVAFAGCVIFLLLSKEFLLPASSSAGVTIAITFLFRVLAIRFDWRTSALLRETKERNKKT